jgi:hypothetical protein
VLVPEWRRQWWPDVVAREEREAKERAALRASGLAKLTAEEKRALGIRGE